MWVCRDWVDYEVLDTSDGEKLERWGRYVLVRPDPQVIWNTEKKDPRWRSADGHYTRSNAGGGSWDVCNLPPEWKISYNNLHFLLAPLGFKHTGLFPEQAVNWDWMAGLIRQAGRPISVLNLFGYTGAATAACAAAGAKVCHVDAAKGMVNWAKRNLGESGLADAPVRYLVDDCKKFVEREIRRGNRYDAILMDPPSYGRGPGGEVWKLEQELYGFVAHCVELLSEKPLFFLINSYTTGLAPSVLHYLLSALLVPRFGGTVTADEIGLPVTSSGLVLPCGASGRWEGTK